SAAGVVAEREAGPWPHPSGVVDRAASSSIQGRLFTRPARLMSSLFGGGGLSSVHDLPAILGAILDGYFLPVDGFHGVVHWARVPEDGLRIAAAKGADREVLTPFARF